MDKEEKLSPKKNKPPKPPLTLKSIMRIITILLIGIVGFFSGQARLYTMCLNFSNLTRGYIFVFSNILILLATYIVSMFAPRELEGNINFVGELIEGIIYLVSLYAIFNLITGRCSKCIA